MLTEMDLSPYFFQVPVCANRDGLASLFFSRNQYVPRDMDLSLYFFSRYQYVLTEVDLSPYFFQVPVSAQRDGLASLFFPGTSMCSQR